MQDIPHHKALNVNSTTGKYHGMSLIDKIAELYVLRLM